MIALVAPVLYRQLTLSYASPACVYVSLRQVQGFWRMYNHMMRPNDLPNTMDYHLFKTGIKPMWEVRARAASHPLLNQQMIH